MVSYIFFKYNINKGTFLVDTGVVFFTTLNAFTIRVHWLVHGVVSFFTLLNTFLKRAHFQLVHDVVIFLQY